MNQPLQLKDHKQIGQELELFFTNDIAPGAPFWLPKGMIIFKELEKYIRELTSKAGYQETSTTIMVKSELFKQSGHWDKFGVEAGVKEVYGGHGMYNLPIYDDEEIEEHLRSIERGKPSSDLLVHILPSGNKQYMPKVNYSLKPMNCPESTLIYRFKTRSYKDLPLRLSEIGRLHRREKSGEVNGLLRVRQITMDDAHIYATEDQIFSEINNILDMMITFYKNFGFEFDFRLATRPEKFAGTKENWEKAEKELEKALKTKKLKYSMKDQDGAFYGPKIDVHIKDSLGREWQLATVQLDFHQPEAFKLSYVDNEGKEQRPVMIHRAIFGSFERFIGILTEHYQGVFPLWLSPVQVMIMPITDKQDEHAKKIVEELREFGIRAELDNRPERLQAKIRDSSLQKVPYLGIIGDKEVKSSPARQRVRSQAKSGGKLKVQSYGEHLISIRTRSGKDLGQIKLSDFLNKLREEIDKKI